MDFCHFSREAAEKGTVESNEEADREMDLRRMQETISLTQRNGSAYRRQAEKYAGSGWRESGLGRETKESVLPQIIPVVRQ